MLTEVLFALGLLTVIAALIHRRWKAGRTSLCKGQHSWFVPTPGSVDLEPWQTWSDWGWCLRCGALKSGRLVYMPLEKKFEKAVHAGRMKAIQQ